MKTALAKALDAKGYTTLTAVQEAVSDPALAGRDLLVSAQTGSGKTLGFGLAIAPTLLGEAEAFARAGAPLALVIAPTRELALQVKRELAWLFAPAGAVIASTVGGMDMRDERRALARGAHIVVATPGRLRDHIMRETIDLGGLRAVVLDEADEMLDLGFREDLEFILDRAPEDRQTLLFSATVPASIAKLAQSYQRDAERIATTTGARQHADIEYRAFNVSARDGENAVINVLRYYEAPNAIVFCNTRAMVNRLTTRLSNRGFSVVALSGELSQNERTHALQAMRDGRARVCVATDVAARGIDLPNLELVIHAELPNNQDTLLHRSGRTGRAGRKGVSALIVPPAARKKAQRLLGWAKVSADWGDAPSAEAVLARDDERMLAGEEWTGEIDAGARDAVDALMAAFSAEQIAAAYLRMYRARHSAPEDLSDANAAPKARGSFGPSVWYELPGGRAAGAEPRRLLPMLCRMGALSRDDVGAIRIREDVSWVEISAGSVAGLEATLGPGLPLEDGAALRRLETAPVPDRGPMRDGPGKGPKRAGPKRAGPKPEGPAGGSQDKAPAPRKAASDGTTTPVDWNDAPTPRVKKPKAATKGTGGPKGAGGPKGIPRHVPEAGPAEPWTPRGPKGKAKAAGKPRGKDGGKPGYKVDGKPGGKGGSEDAPRQGRGPKPPIGKPSSKKNRARALAKKAGEAAPRKPRASKTKPN